jgi:hypothetical protein
MKGRIRLSGGRGSRRAVLFNPRMPEERLGKLRRTQSSRTLARTSAKRLGSFRQRLRRGQQRSTLVNHGQPASSDAASDIPPSHAHRNKSKMTAPKPPARLGSFCEMPAVVNGGQRWSMAVNRRQRRKGQLADPLISWLVANAILQFSNHRNACILAHASLSKMPPRPPHTFIPSHPQNFRQIPRKSGRLRTPLTRRPPTSVDGVADAVPRRSTCVRLKSAMAFACGASPTAAGHRYDHDCSYAPIAAVAVSYVVWRSGPYDGGLGGSWRCPRSTLTRTCGPSSPRHGT